MRRPSAHRVVGIRRRAVNQLQTKICAHPPRCQQSMDCHPPRDVRRVPLPFACADEFRCRTKNAALCITRRVQEIGSRGVRVMDGKMRGALIPPTKKANALSRPRVYMYCNTRPPTQPCTPPVGGPMNLVHGGSDELSSYLSSIGGCKGRPSKSSTYPQRPDQTPPSSRGPSSPC